MVVSNTRWRLLPVVALAVVVSSGRWGCFLMLVADGGFSLGVVPSGGH